MKIQVTTAGSPERYQCFDGKFIYLCQIEDDDFTLSIIKSKNSNKAYAKCEVLYKGNTDDFCYDYDGRLEYGQLDIEIAFRNFITT